MFGDVARGACRAFHNVVYTITRASREYCCHSQDGLCDCSESLRFSGERPAADWSCIAHFALPIAGTNNLTR